MCAVTFVEMRVDHVSRGTVGTSRSIWILHRVFITRRAAGVTHTNAEGHWKVEKQKQSAHYLGSKDTEGSGRDKERHTVTEQHPLQNSLLPL